MSEQTTKKPQRRFADLFSTFGIMQSRNNRIKMLNCCISLDLIFSFSIFGYISINPIAMTTVHIPVIIAAMFAGPLSGAATGMIFGLTSMWKASVSATVYGDLIFSPWKSGSAAGSLVLSIGTRMAFGFVAGLMFSLLFKKVKRKWYAAGTAVIAIIATMLHSFFVSLAMNVFFPKAKSGLLSSVSPSLRHITVWVITAAVLVLVYKIFSSQGFLSEYKEVVEYKRSHKTQGNRLLMLVMALFLIVSAAIVMHSFDRLSLIDITGSNKLGHTDMTAVNIAIQQLLALLGAIYIISLLLMFVYEKGNIASSKLKETEQEAAYQQKLQKTLDVLQALTRDYEVVMNTDIRTGTVKLYKCSEEMSKIISEDSLRLPFYEGGERFFTMLAAEEELPKLLEQTSEQKVLEYLKNDRIYVQVFKSKDGVYGETKIVPISDHEFVCGYTNVDAAIREKMKQQEKLEQAMRAAEAANEAKSTFLLNMSHDIRTPMNAIIGYTDILSKYRSDEAQFERCTGNIKASGKYLLDLINNVLEMARIESGVEELKETPNDIRTILGSTYIVFKEEAEKKGITLTYEREIQHDFLWCDKVKLQELHLNVISNAVKYTDAGGEIRIFSKELPDDREGWCRIQTTTTDTGIGMSEEFVKHIFEDFSRENDSTSSSTPGTGLGMGIVKKLVDMMGGEITVDSKKGKGTTVRITIAHRIADESLVEKETSTADISLFKGRRVLLAEDNDLNAEIAAELLTDVGLRVERAKDGKVCVSMLEKEQPGYYDLILMDVQMPNMGGYEATALIRKLPDKKRSQIPIIAMTANAFAKDRKEAFAAGMNEHISKPISIDKLVHAMSEFIGQ